MHANRFYDTNVVVYYFAGDPQRTGKAEQLIHGGGTIGVQVLNEFVHVAQRKMKWNWKQIEFALAAMENLLGSPTPLTHSIHLLGLELARHHKLSIYDALIVAAAQDAGCSHLYTEDLQHGRKFGTLTIFNPFLTQPN